MANSKKKGPAKVKAAKRATPGQRLRPLLPRLPPPSSILPSQPLQPHPDDFDPDTFDPTLPIGDMSDMPLHDNEPGSDELEQTQPLGGVTAEDGDPFTDAGTNSFGGTDSMFDPDLVSPRVPASPAQAGGGAFQFQNLPFATPGNNFNLAHHLEARNQPDQFGQFNQFGQFGQFDQFDHFGQLGQFGQFNQFNQFPNPQTPFNNSHGNFGNMASLEPLLPQAASEASGQHHDPATPSPARITGQAGDMMSPRAQFMQATAATGDREQDFQADTPAHIPLNLAHFDERIYDPGLVDNPFENQGPAKTVQDAGLRVRFHIEKLNRLHAIRIADNDKISFNYFTQGNWVNESIVDYIAILSGVRLTSNLIAEYNDNPDPNSLFKIARFVRHALIPKLRDVGPQLKAYMEAIIRTIQDPQYKHSCYVHVSNSFYLVFCGIKSSLLVIDRHRQENPDLYPAEMPAFSFENLFPITRQMMLIWMLPGNDDHSLGDYDHYFVNQGPPPDQEDMPATLDAAVDDDMA